MDVRTVVFVVAERGMMIKVMITPPHVLVQECAID